MALPSKLDSKYNYTAWKKSGYAAPGKRPPGFSKELPKIEGLLGVKKKSAANLKELQTRLEKAASIARERRLDLMTPLASMSTKKVRELKNYLDAAQEYYKDLRAQITQKMIDEAEEKDEKKRTNDTNEQNAYRSCLANLKAILSELTAKRDSYKADKPKLKQALAKARDYLKKIAPEAKKRKGALQLDDAAFGAFDEAYLASVVRTYWGFDEKAYNVSAEYDRRIKEILKDASVIGKKEYKKELGALTSSIQSCHRECASLAKELAGLQAQLAKYYKDGPIIYKAYSGRDFRLPGAH
ncbi:putative phage infection (PIP) family protein YhgE [Ereboglobus sp. PH5-5]|uniref:hypothetical protein n=1 Tax=unclassified Ereboglobus TaxID=2626932 RepID=UPI002405A27A|nr:MULTISPECIES: hypothetical protein [unclassified Ereboglobus]MDF9826564.1 putative phage infection (PIP) family protein YhgE [Ereboglobus sp. PH5-10]MDF9832754.1 putative phage infection (PIP) family protein YhgE [Ereboglobus sp. PH5-5]